MEVGDCSLWHYLIFCEEFVTDDYENDVVCWVCRATVSRHPAFKCLECVFVQHKSCTQLSNMTEIDVKHGILDKHHLILWEETENNEKEEVICMGCGELAFGPTYRCSISQCTFQLHKSCHQLHHAILHIEHPEHTLTLQLPTNSRICDLCGKNIEKGTSLVYRCNLCEFDMDGECATPLEVIDIDCDEHKFIAGRKPIQFTCEACGVETKGVSSQCITCRVMTHHYCTRFPPIIKIKAHNHLFSRTYCLLRVQKLKNLEKAICKLCCKKVNTECGAYYCQVCDYIVHMKCAKENQDKSTMNLEVTEFDDYRRHLVYLIEGLNEEEDKTSYAPLKINHYSHPNHELVLHYEDSESDKRCEACMQFIVFSPFYGCDKCNIFLHKRCAELPETIRRLPFPWQLFSLYSQPPFTSKVFRCWLCDRYREGFFYKSEERDSGGLKCDVQCLLIPETIEHESHVHLLHVPVVSYYKLKEACNGCGKNITYGSVKLMCSDCEFILCFTCATFPLIARYRYHPHLLKLTYTCKDDLDECYCLICEEKRDQEHWFYSCTDCDFAAHIQCVIGSSIAKGNHEHPVVLVKTPENSPECHLCEESISDWAIECIQCKFNFHYRCYYSKL